MIERIGVVLQDAHSLGFLKGLKKRLGCDAEFVLPPIPVGKPQDMTRKQARIACAYFRKNAVDLVLRFTDADAARWQEDCRAAALRADCDVTNALRQAS